MSCQSNEAECGQRRCAAGSIVVLVLSLVLGFLISQALTGFLAIEFKDKEVPAERASAVDEVVPGTIAGLGEITLPDDTDPLFAAASRALFTAEATRDVSGTIDVEARIVYGDANPESFTVAVDGERVVVTATGRRGAAQGLFRAADRIRSGHGWASLDGLSETPALEHRFVDTGAVGVVA